MLSSCSTQNAGSDILHSSSYPLVLSTRENRNCWPLAPIVCVYLGGLKAVLRMCYPTFSSNETELCQLLDITRGSEKLHLPFRGTENGYEYLTSKCLIHLHAFAFIPLH
jgi:hypothetical protein